MNKNKFNVRKGIVVALKANFLIVEINYEYSKEYEIDKLSDSEKNLLEELAGHYSARGPQHHHHKSGLFSKLFGKK